jgi:PAS domain-containing protein
VKTLFSIRNHGAIAWVADETGRITKVSDNFEQETGIPPADILGKTLAQYLGELSAEFGRLATDLERTARKHGVAGHALTLGGRAWLCSESVSGESVVGLALACAPFGWS